MFLRESDLLTGWNSEEQVHANLKYKDRLFCLIFGSEEYKENTLLLYNALNHTHYTDACIEDHIMEDFLTDHRSEVLSVCLTEFDEEKFIHTVKAEGKAEGKIEGETNWQNRFKKLTELLSSANRINDILKSASEPEYAKNLMAQYGI